MVILVCYDVATTTRKGRARLRKVADICENHGTRVQYSIFECPLTQTAWVKMKRELLDTYDPQEDSLRFYFLDERATARAEHHGVRSPLDLEGPLIL